MPTLRISRELWFDYAVEVIRQDNDEGWNYFFAFTAGMDIFKINEVGYFVLENWNKLELEAEKRDIQMVEKHRLGTLQIKDVPVGTEVVLSGSKHVVLFVNSCRALVRGTKLKKCSFKPKNKKTDEEPEEEKIVEFFGSTEYNVSPNSPVQLVLD